MKNVEKFPACVAEYRQSSYFRGKNPESQVDPRRKRGTNWFRNRLDSERQNWVSHGQPSDAVAHANWLPAPEDQFALIVRAYVPTQPLLEGRYKLPNVERSDAAQATTSRTTDKVA
jgi:hypothetical protein